MLSDWSRRRLDRSSFTGKYRAVTPEEIVRLAKQAGLQEVCVLPSSNTGFYQPIIVAEAA